MDTVWFVKFQDLHETPGMLLGNFVNQFCGCRRIVALEFSHSTVFTFCSGPWPAAGAKRSAFQS